MRTAFLLSVYSFDSRNYPESLQNSKFGEVKQKKKSWKTTTTKKAIISKTVRKSKRGRESGQTREGIGAVPVRLWRHAFTDAPDTSVVLCFSGGREVRVVGAGDERERAGYSGAKWMRR